MTRVSCAALLFDMDGVLINSTPAVARVWRRWAREHGFDPEEVVAKAHGRPSLSTLREYLPHADHERENREMERREMEDLAGVVPLPGSRRLLGMLSSERWTIVTSSTRPLAELRLRTAGLPIPRNLVTADDVKNGKPHPEPYVKAASALGFSADECVVVEDVPAGVRSGKAAGSRVIAFRSTTGDPELKQAGADWVLDNCADIAWLQDGPKMTLVLAEHKSTQGQPGEAR